AIGAARQRLADHLGDARRPGRADDHFAAVLLLEPERLLERVGVGLVHLEAGVLVADPGFVVVEAGLPLAGGDLLDADGNFHSVSLRLAPATRHERHENAKDAKRKASFSCFSWALLFRVFRGFMGRCAMPSGLEFLE